MMEATKNRPLYGCTNCYEDYSWPAVDLAVYEGECWCENCWDGRRWEGGMPYFSDLDDFVPEHEKQLQAEREKVRVLREALEIARHDLLGIVPPGSRTIRVIRQALATTQKETSHE